MDHVCHFLLTRTRATGFEYRVCHTCGATPPQTIILSSREMSDRLRPAAVCAEEKAPSVAQHTERDEQNKTRRQRELSAGF
jgi:hypothetical protein